MLILKYFASTGAVLIAALWALSTYLEPSNSDAPALLHTSATISLPTQAPRTTDAIHPEPEQPKAAAASVRPVHRVHHRSPGR
jgi:hypothetical protein